MANNVQEPTVEYADNCTFNLPMSLGIRTRFFQNLLWNTLQFNKPTTKGPTSESPFIYDTGHHLQGSEERNRLRTLATLTLLS